MTKYFSQRSAAPGEVEIYRGNFSNSMAKVFLESERGRNSVSEQRLGFEERRKDSFFVAGGGK
jgi:hypothetical protein